MNWEVIACAGALAVVVVRPWRLFWPRNLCPQGDALLPRWNAWGWREDWDCPRCGCLINR
jgi:hypothetical protein